MRVAIADLNDGFGVVPVDPDQGLYALEIDADKVPAQSEGKPYRGPFASHRSDGHAAKQIVVRRGSGLKRQQFIGPRHSSGALSS